MAKATHDRIWRLLAGAALYLTITTVPVAQAMPALLAAKKDRHPVAPAARVAVVRDGTRTVLTLGVDYDGSASDLVLLVPVPASITAKALNVAEPGLFSRLDAATAARIVELQDKSPCDTPKTRDQASQPGTGGSAPGTAQPSTGGSAPVDAKPAPAAEAGSSSASPTAATPNTGGSGAAALAAAEDDSDPDDRDDSEPAPAPAPSPAAPATPPAPKPEPHLAAPPAHGLFHPVPGEVGTPTFTILTGKDAAHPTTWLSRHGYHVPAGAAKALKPDQKRHAAFVAVQYHLDHAPGLHHLRPVQLAFESDSLSLPLRLGRASIPKTGQTLQIYGLTRTGRLETQAPPPRRPVSGVELPPAVLQSKLPFYDAMTSHAASHGAPLLEYAWEATWCDPCVAPTLTPAELRRLGTFWVDPHAQPPKTALRSAMQAVPSARTQDVFLTRLFLAAGPKDHQDDLALVPTDDHNTLQTRFVVRPPYTGSLSCDAALPYREALPGRRETEAQTLARLTGWDIATVRRQLDLRTPATPGKTWVDDLWTD